MSNSELIDISGLSKAAVLAALYNASKQQGMGFVHTRGQRDMTEEEAAAELGLGDDHVREFGGSFRAQTYFDYLHGRVLKVDLSGDQLNPRLYDRDNGEGAAARVIARLRQ